MGPARLRQLVDKWIAVRDRARERRLLVQAMRGRDPGKMLVVGPVESVRHAFAPATFDVAGTERRDPQLTVCSRVLGRGSLPTGRWDTIVLTEPCSDWNARWDAVLPACRAAASVLVLADDRWGMSGEAIGALRTRTSTPIRTLVSGKRRAIVAQVS